MARVRGPRGRTSESPVGPCPRFPQPCNYSSTHCASSHLSLKHMLLSVLMVSAPPRHALSNVFKSMTLRTLSEACSHVMPPPLTETRQSDRAGRRDLPHFLQLFNFAKALAFGRTADMP